VPLGILMTRFPTLAGPLQASATVLLTVPSIALFGLLLPFYSNSARAWADAGDHRRVPLFAAADHAQHLPGPDQRRTGHP
jgi:ABC-type proline/glycine betaine transport system permease subunit